VTGAAAAGDGSVAPSGVADIRGAAGAAVAERR
jgi:hypothetical protein